MSNNKSAVTRYVCGGGPNECENVGCCTYEDILRCGLMQYDYCSECQSIYDAEKWLLNNMNKQEVFSMV